MTSPTMLLEHDSQSEAFNMHSDVLHPPMRVHEIGEDTLYIFGHPIYSARRDDNAIKRSFAATSKIDDFARNLDGNFLIIVRNQKLRRLQIISDRFASNSLYFAQRGGTLGFHARGDATEKDNSLEKDYSDVEESLKRTFRPEFLNRIDEVILFHVLSRAQIKLIVDLQMKEVADRLMEHSIEIELTETAREWLAKEGYDPQFGARPLRRMLQRKVESPLSRQLLAGEFKAGDAVIVDADEKAGIVFRKKEGVPAEPGVLMEAPPSPVEAG